MTQETIILGSNDASETPSDQTISQSNSIETSGENDPYDEQPNSSNSQSSLVFISCSSESKDPTADSPSNCQVKLPPHLQKRLSSSRNSARKTGGKSKEDLENEQKLAEERRAKLRLDAKQRREELDNRVRCVMMNYDFICKQQLLRKGVKIEGEQAASTQELNQAVKMVNIEMNNLNAGLQKNLRKALEEAKKL